MKLEDLILLHGLFSIVAMFVCHKQAIQLNRSKVGWGLFGLILPIIAVIWVLNIKPIIKQ